MEHPAGHGHESFSGTMATKRNGTVIVVSPSGNDSNPGTASRPKKSIQAAIVAARPRGTVLLRGGVYMEGAPINVTAEDSGLTLTSWPGEPVTISGGKPLPSPVHWQPVKGNIFVTDVPLGFNIKGLRLNDKRMIRARFPVC